MMHIKRSNPKIDFTRHNKKPIAYKINKNKVKFILDRIKINKIITMENLLEKLKIKFNDLKYLFILFL